jgi:hypothetical protein
MESGVRTGEGLEDVAREEGEEDEENFFWLEGDTSSAAEEADKAA